MLPQQEEQNRDERVRIPRPSDNKRNLTINNNDILRRLRYSFDFNDSKMITIFSQAELAVTRSQISDWLKKDEDPDQQYTDQQIDQNPHRRDDEIPYR